MGNKALIRVDYEGRWYYCNRKIIRNDIIEELLKKLKIDEKGNCWIEWEGEKEIVEVEDTVFIVKWIEKEWDDFKIKLNDGTEETLDLDTFYLSPKGIPYCRVKKRHFSSKDFTTCFLSTRTTRFSNRQKFHNKV